MKSYKINLAKPVGTTKNGIEWRYKGRTKNLEETIKEYEDFYRWSNAIAVRITDTDTNEIVYEKWI